MRSDLTCPVEITKVIVNQEKEDTKESAQIVCLIDFFNLSDKVIDSLQMNIICFDADGVRLGGRLVRAAAPGEPRSVFSGSFAPEHVDGAVRVEASVEKVWYQDGVIWRREDRNVREYTPNNLPEGRELDRLRAVAGPDAAGYSREDDIVWMCVCGRANRTSDDKCWRCERSRAQVLAEYSFAAIDSTAGKKERDRQAKTQDTLRRSSETTVREQSEIQRKSRRRRRTMKVIVWLLVVVALLLAAARWGVPYGADWYAGRLMSEGKLAEAKEIYLFIDHYWPDMTGAKENADQAETMIIEGLIAARSDRTLEEAAQRAQALESAQAEALYERAVIERANLAIESGDTDKAEALFESLTGSEEAAKLHNELVYSLALAAREQVDYPEAIARYESLGDYLDAKLLKEDCIYDYGRQLLREEHYAAACEQFMLVSGRSDAITLIRQCRYALALEKQENGDYIAAAKDFESLGVYEEAETRGKFCRYTAGMNALENGSMEIAAENLKLAEDYEDAQARFADVAFTLGFAALEKEDYPLAIEWLSQLPREGEAGEALDRATYAYALSLKEQGDREAAALEFASLGDYEDAHAHVQEIEYDLACEEMETSPEGALPRFEQLGDYRDAEDKADACRYALAQNQYAAGEYEAALAAFEALGTYEDSKNQVKRSRYALAAQKMEEAAYDEAAALFKACGAYLDAEDRAMRAQYEKAAALEAQQEYALAADAFAALGSYEDAKLRVTQNENAWLQKAYNSARMDMELGDYDSAIEALAPLWQGDLPERYADMQDMYIDACLARSDALIGQDRPLDALPLLESIEDVSKTAKKRLDAYVYRIIGRWKDSKGVEYIFRRDGSCSIAGEELYFGGSGYDIMIGSEPYPTKPGYGVVNLKNGTLTIKRRDGEEANIRLNYVGEPTEKPEPGAAAVQEAETAQTDVAQDEAADTAQDADQNAALDAAAEETVNQNEE